MTVFQIPFHQNQPVGEQTFTSSGSFTVPTDVYRISAVVVGAGGGGGDGGSNNTTAGGGGGALAFVSNLPVTPGEVLTITVGTGGAGGAGTGSGGLSRIARGATNLVTANGGTNAANVITTATTAGGTFSFDPSITAVAGITTGGGNGGAGGSSSAAGPAVANGGGGGAGGYTAAGGAGGNGSGLNTDGSASTGGGGGGGESSTAVNNCGGGGGGGVALLGSGTNGSGGANNAAAGGGGGSAGTSGTAGGAAPGNAGPGGAYGGGGGGSSGNAVSASGANGAVRIVWGQNRFFPTTNVDRSVAFLTSAVSSASTISIPSTAQEGDVAFLFDNGYNATSTAPTGVTPTGWTLAGAALGFVNDAGNVSVAGRCSYKILTSSDPGATVTGINGAGGNRKTMLIFRPNFTVTSLSLSVASNTVTTTDPIAQTISMTAATAPAIGFAHMGTYTGAVTTRSVTGGAMTEVSNTTNQYVQYVIDNTVNTITDSTVDIADGGTNTLQSFYANLNGFPYG